MVQVKTFAYIGVLFVALSSSWTKLRGEERKQGNKKRSKEARKETREEGSREAGNATR